MAPKTQLLISFAAAASLVGTAIAAPPPQAGRKLSAVLNGANECDASGTCNLGDPDGTGTANITVNVGQQRVCWKITTSNLSTITRAHIHKAPAGIAGPIVVGFFEANDVRLDGCTPTTQPLDRRLLQDIIQHPQAYYVNVHTVDFPNGAIRGQLSKK
ncbi:MAG TPA: CHRD domain-containing protein [Sphingomicrobium sp.]|nr:CHRD domain-containing protein [Sphingomicrobium sp.]